MFRASCVLVFILVAFASASAQWQMQDSQSTASFRGVHSVDGQVAWASGTSGTVLHTTDGGAHWEKCAVPSDAEKLDFRAVWAWDAKNAVVLSIGNGEQSRIYRTSDACATWKEEARNHDKDGFWDGIVFAPGDANTGVLVGDPIQGHLDIRLLNSKGEWAAVDPACPANPGEGAFAASNSSLFVFGPQRYVIGTGGKSGPRVVFSDARKGCRSVPVPLASGNESSGVFSVYFRDRKHGIAVGGDYRKTTEPGGSAAWTFDGGEHWTASSKMPHGFRSAVMWDPAEKAWIAAGPNGSDISRDGGKTWEPLDDGNWNALSLPYVVGPKGRVGKLDRNLRRLPVSKP